MSKIKKRSMKSAVAKLERKMMIDALRDCGGHVVWACDVLMVHRTSFYRKMKTYRINPNRYRR